MSFLTRTCALVALVALTVATTGADAKPSKNMTEVAEQSETSLSRRQLVAQAGAFSVLSGACFTNSDGSCLYSDHWNWGHVWNNQQCTIRANYAIDLTVTYWSTESCCDKLQIGSTYYSGGSTPAGVTMNAGSVMYWRTDHSVVYRGWNICAQSRLPPHPTGISNAFSVSSGSCHTNSDRSCFYSPSYPNNYGNSQTCSITVSQNTELDPQAFNTESGYDWLTVNGARYMGTNAPTGVYVSAGSTISWRTDGSVTRTGFAICSGIPATPSPTTASPTPSPTTVAPTTSPTSMHPTSAHPTTISPTNSPTGSPTRSPTMHPTTRSPTMHPTTYHPTTMHPTTISPTTVAPTTVSPTVSPTRSPTTSPTTVSPTTDAPTTSPTTSPTTVSPTTSPTRSPTTKAPTTSPTTLSPTTKAPTKAPTGSPTTVSPTNSPSTSPTTASPTTSPTTKAPTTQAPSTSPTPAPTGSPTEHWLNLGLEHNHFEMNATLNHLFHGTTADVDEASVDAMEYKGPQTDSASVGPLPSFFLLVCVVGAAVTAMVALKRGRAAAADLSDRERAPLVAAAAPSAGQAEAALAGEGYAYQSY